MNNVEYLNNLDSLHRLHFKFLCVFTDLYHECKTMNIMLECMESEKRNFALAYELNEIDPEEDTIANRFKKIILDKMNEEYNQTELGFNLYIAKLKAVYKALKDVCNAKSISFEHVVKWTEIDDLFPYANRYLEKEVEINETFYLSAYEIFIR